MRERKEIEDGRETGKGDVKEKSLLVLPPHISTIHKFIPIMDSFK